MEGTPRQRDEVGIRDSRGGTRCLEHLPTMAEVISASSLKPASLTTAQQFPSLFPKASSHSLNTQQSRQREQHGLRREESPYAPPIATMSQHTAVFSSNN